MAGVIKSQQLGMSSFIKNREEEDVKSTFLMYKKKNRNNNKIKCGYNLEIKEKGFSMTHYNNSLKSL